MHSLKPIRRSIDIQLINTAPRWCRSVSHLSRRSRAPSAPSSLAEFRRPKIPKSFDDAELALDNAIKRLLRQRDTSGALHMVARLLQTRQSLAEEAARARIIALSREQYSRIIKLAYNPRRPESFMRIASEVISSLRAAGLAPDEELYNRLVATASQAGLGLKAVVSLLAEMKRDNVKPNNTTALTLVRLLIRLQMYESVFQFLDEIRRDGVEPDADLFAELFYAGVVSKKEAFPIRIFREFESSKLALNAACCAQLARACVDAETHWLFPRLFNTLRRNNGITVEMYHAMLSASLEKGVSPVYYYISSAFYFEHQDLFKSFKQQLSGPEVTSKSSESSSNPSESPDSSVTASPNMKLQRDVPVEETPPPPLGASSEPKVLEESEPLDSLLELARAYGNELTLEALRRFLSASTRVISPELLAEPYSNVIVSAARAELDEHLSVIFEHFRETRFQPSFQVLHAFLNACRLAGQSNKGFGWFKLLQQKTGLRNLNSQSLYNELLQLAQFTGLSRDIEEILLEMEREGILASDFTFSVVMRAFSGAGLPQYSADLHKEMQELDLPLHYNSLVLLIQHYAENGHLNIALELYHTFRDKYPKGSVTIAATILHSLIESVDDRSAANDEERRTWLKEAKFLVAELFAAHQKVSKTLARDLLKFFQKHNDEGWFRGLLASAAGYYANSPHRSDQLYFTSTSALLEKRVEM